MAHGVGEVVGGDGSAIKIHQSNHHHQQINHQQSLQQQQQQQQQHQSGSQSARKNVGVMGSRRIFAAAFKLKVLDSYRNDIDCRGNQRATARKYGIHRRQIQKWLQCEENLRSSCAESNSTTTVTSSGCCTVPVGSSASAATSASASPTSSSVVALGEISSKTDVTTSAASPSSSSSVCASLINATGNNPNNNNNINNNNSSSCNGIASLGVATSVGTPIATPAPATPVPALNLSLARLHGDEQHQQQQQQHQQLAARQGPPPHLPPVPPVAAAAASLRHSSRRASSPTSSPQYTSQHNHNSHNNNNHHHHHHHRVPSSSPSGSMPLRNILVGYTDYVSQQEALQHHHHHQQQQNHQRHQRRQQSSERPRHDDEQHQQQQQQQHLHEKLMEDSCSPERKYSYVINRTAANYDHDVIRGNGSTSRSPNSEAYYQTLETYHNAAAGFAALRSNNNNNNNNNSNNNNTKEIGLGGISPSYQDKRSNVDSAGNACEPPSPQPPQTTSFASSSSSSPLLLLHATTIKSERASPDSLATPGPCETPGSPESVPSMPRARLNHHHQQHQQRLTDLAAADTCSGGNTSPIDVCSGNTSTRNGGSSSLVHRASAATAAAATAAAAAIATASAAAVHSNETTSRPLAHVHVSVDSHASNARDSENQQREREQHRQQQQQQQQLRRDSVKVEYEERMGRRVKEEIVDREEVETTTSNSGDAASMTTTTAMMMMMREPKREMTEEEALVERSRYHRERTTTADVVASCPDYQGAAAAAAAAPAVGTPTGLSSGGCSGLASPIARDPVGGTYSGLSSPRAASSSGISTSSSCCSDSEIDPLDYSSSSARSAMITDLSRRRSFSLRFKLGVLDAFHGDAGVAGNQRATARKFGINRRQVQKWLGQESELRGEIALRGGDLRQRLGPMTEANNVESSIPVDLRTGSATTGYSALGGRNENELENSSPPLYCCDVGSSSQRLGYYNHGRISAESPDIQPRSSCSLSCCADGLANASLGCYQETASQRRSSVGYPESQGSLYCYSPRDPLESGSGSEGIDVTRSSSSPLKRTACTLTCCYHLVMPSPKRICLESVEEEPRSSPTGQGQPPQEAPLCLVKPRSSGGFGDSTMQTEPVTSTVPTPPAQPVATPTSKKNAILFKPYLDNPVSKPTEDTRLNHQPGHRGLSPSSAQSVIVNNNNNCQGACNLNEERTIVGNTQADYALELSLRVPVTWRTHHGGYGEFPERLRSAFVRYPTSPHYT